MYDIPGTWLTLSRTLDHRIIVLQRIPPRETPTEGQGCTDRQGYWEGVPLPPPLPDPPHSHLNHPRFASAATSGFACDRLTFDGHMADT